MAKILLQRNSDGKDITIEDDLIISVYTLNSITTIEYLSEEDGYRKIVAVEQTLANVGAMSNLLISLQVSTGNQEVDSGVSDASTTHNLTDATQNFVTTVSVGDRVHNTTADTWGTVLTVTGNTALALDEDIFDGTGSENYVIFDGTGETSWVNEFRINSIDELYKLGTVYVDAAGASPKAIKLATNANAVRTASITKNNDYSLAIGSYTAAPNTIVLAASAGDKTAEFTAGVVFTVYGENTANDGIYSVVSSVEAAGVTTITVTETPTAATSYGGLVWLKSEVGADVSTSRGVVTQTGAITTGVTIGTKAGVITTVSSTLAAGSNATFIVTNSLVTASSVIQLTVDDSATAGLAKLNVQTVAAGVFSVNITNIHTANAFNNTLDIHFLVV